MPSSFAGAARLAAEHDRPRRGPSPRRTACPSRSKSARSTTATSSSTSARPKATPSLEPQIEAVVRQHVRRGTVQVNLRVDREPSADDYRLNEAVLAGLSDAARAADWAAALVEQRARWRRCWRCRAWSASRRPSSTLIEAQWPLIESRADRGAAAAWPRCGSRKAGRWPPTWRPTPGRLPRSWPPSSAARRRWSMPIARGCRTGSTSCWPNWACRSSRPTSSARSASLPSGATFPKKSCGCKSHLEQFDTVDGRRTSRSGRKLEFLTQEMFRETNTIGSKANDAEIARHVIEMKTAIERMREMIQNVE